MLSSRLDGLLGQGKVVIVLVIASELRRLLPLLLLDKDGLGGLLSSDEVLLLFTLLPLTLLGNGALVLVKGVLEPWVGRPTIAGHPRTRPHCTLSLCRRRRQ